jgi:hypothetical protein
MDRQMREEGGHTIEYNTTDTLLLDLVRDVREMKNRLTELESAVHKLLKSKE